MKAKILIAGWLMLLCVTSLPAQDRLVSGQVLSDQDGNVMAGANVILKGTTRSTVTDAGGRYSMAVPGKGAILIFSSLGYATQEIPVGPRAIINVRMVIDKRVLQEVVVTGHGAKQKPAPYGKKYDQVADMANAAQPEYEAPQVGNTEEYDAIHENIFHGALMNPLSTFSIDVDAASYSNMRRFIQNGQRPPVDAVRIEEMINYFDYNYKQPQGQDPFSIYTEIAAAPWNQKHKLVHIGLQGKIIPTDNLPPSNLVFLIDVSGSMDAPNKLPLLKSSFKMLVAQLREQDRVAIVVYAGAAGLVLPSTPGNEKNTIIRALDNLQAGGSTAGGAGINLAYAIAKENFRRNGNNRIILATDGDFNVGESSNASMERLIEQKRNDGIFLTVLGFGMGNYKDSKMEILADKGNGNYAYIDTFSEAQKVLGNEFGGTLFTIAKDVKLQVEFNPEKVKAYRLIGYENRVMKNEDFNNDKKDAGELGSGHTVTALYEIIPQGVDSEFYSVDKLKYQKVKPTTEGRNSQELLTVKFRYKEPDGEAGKLIVQTLSDSNKSVALASEDFKWSAAVAAFGMLLRDSEYVKGFTYEDVLQLAQLSRGQDKEGYRAEFINLVKSRGLVASR